MAQLQSTVLVVSAAHVASPRCLLGTTLTPRAPHLRRAAAPVSLFNFGRKESDEEAAKEEPATDAEVKRLRAEKLQLQVREAAGGGETWSVRALTLCARRAARPQAELAELEAEKLSAGARQLAPPSASPPPLPPPAAVSPAPPSPAAPASVSESAAQLCVTLDGAVKAMGLESSEPLQRTVLQAWSEARVSQSAEIATLRRQLDSAVELEAAATPDEDQSFGEAMATVSLRFEETERSRRGETDANQLWLMAENRTGSRVERRARARALTKASFKFLATLTAYDETEEQAGEEGKVAVPGEGLISVAASRQRLRLLERHDAAECVECAARRRDASPSHEAPPCVTLMSHIRHRLISASDRVDCETLLSCAEPRRRPAASRAGIGSLPRRSRTRMASRRRRVRRCCSSRRRSPRPM
jgi:hypothetical protein